VLVALSLTAPAVVRASPDDGPLTASGKSAIVERVASAVTEHYVDAGAAVEMARLLRSSLEDGRYDDIDDLADLCSALTADLRSVSDDRHLRVAPFRGGEVENGEPDPRERRSRLLTTWQRENFGFRQVSLLDGNLGYIDLRGFYDAHAGGPTAVAAMGLVAHCDALIVDLRANTGGQPSMIQLLCSFLFDDSTHLGSFYRRKGESIQQFWTQAHVPGPRLADVPVYVLVGAHTFSAAEAFAYDLKHLGRAVIVGETTGGGAHPQAQYDFPDESVSVNIPYGKAVNPVTGTNWEGVGVTPDVAVPAAEALEVARIEALEILLADAVDEGERHALRMIQKEAEARLRPVDLPDELLRSYVGSYERGIAVTVDRGSLRVLHYVLAPMGDDRFMVTQGDEQVQFDRDEGGRVTGFSVLFRDGRSIGFARLDD
jgi:hypothetical protein